MVRGKKSRQRRRRASQSFAQTVRQFLTPEVFEQAHRARGAKRRSPRWDVQPLLFVLLLTTFCAGDSSAERFEAARAFYVVCHETRKRPGQTLQGFQTVHRELAGSLMGLQLMLAQAALRLHPCSSLWSEPDLASPRKVLLEIRREIAAVTPARRRRAFSHRIAQATLERRVRSSHKQNRAWPRRKPHKPPAAPQIITLSDEQKALLRNLETAA